MGNILSHLFYLFFTSPVLSPAIADISIYLFLFIPFLDVDFLRNFFCKNINRSFLFSSILLVVASIPFASLHFLSKILTIIVALSYMWYTRQAGRFHLYPYIQLNVCIALIQAVGLLGFQQSWLYPSDVANSLWGSYALGTGPTPEEAQGILLLFRFSGLSREPGFFASLLIASFLLLLDDRNASARRLHLLGHIIGIVVSFSKISIAFFAVFCIVFPLRRLVERVPKIAIVLGSAIVLTTVTFYVYDKQGVDYINQSFQHRTFGYAVLRYLSLQDLLFGVGFRNIVSRAGQIPIILHSSMISNYPDMIVSGSGIASIIIDHGILFLAILVFILYLLDVNSYALLLFLALSINDNPLSSQSYVLLGMYYMLFSRKSPFLASPRLQASRPRIWGVSSRTPTNSREAAT